MKSNIRHCLRCQTEMIKVSVVPGGGAVIIQELKKGTFIKRKTATASGYLCTECGQVELVIDKPEIFKNLDI